MYIFMQSVGVGNCTPVLSLIASQRMVVYRERFSGMYSLWAYSLSQVEFHEFSTKRLI